MCKGGRGVQTGSSYWSVPQLVKLKLCIHTSIIHYKDSLHFANSCRYLLSLNLWLNLFLMLLMVSCSVENVSNERVLRDVQRPPEHPV